MAPNEHATTTAPEEFEVLHQNVENPKNSKAQIVSAEQYSLLARPEKPRFDKGRAISRQIMAAAFASLSSVSIGFITSYSSLTLQQLRNDTSLDYVDSRDSGWIVVVVSYIIGIQRALSALSRFPHLLIVVSLLREVYATEIAEPQIRGLMGAFPEAAVALGSLLCYGFGAVVDWRWLAILSAVVPGVPLFLRCPAARVHHAIKRKTIASEVIQKPQNWKPVLVVFLVFICGQFSGFAVVTAYTVDIFNEASTNLDPNTATVIVGIVRFIATLVSAVLLDRVGRKPLLIISAIGSSVGMVSIGAFFYLKATGQAEGFGLLPLASLLVYVFFNELGYGPIPWLLSGELIPLAVRTIGNGVAVTAYSLAAFIIGLTFPYLTALMSSYIVFWLYALFSLSGVFLGVFLPETRGKTLEEIEKFFIPKNPTKNPTEFKKLSNAC
ncbi:Facilitated trehalose transporter Tret1 [Chionoecetes opilio]|uniref:Facilitated trehalose transporter Tret1 n=1 Tax=Chionoecetes opilio TaxID=41210 RepID=A0A8J5CLC5_CHIOP|nr:Facilitated trehalose transporter Tret1 [Chionoecetes opilio]